MKALTIPQPYATLLTVGGAHSYALPWATAYRGPLAIHAAEAYAQDARDAAAQEPLRSTLRRAGFRHWIDLPTGAVIAVATLVGCDPCGAPGDERVPTIGVAQPGGFAWRLSEALLLPCPIVAHDAVGLWEWPIPPELADLLGGPGQRLLRGHGPRAAQAIEKSPLR